MLNEEDAQELPDESFARLTIYSRTSSAQELADALGVSPDESSNKGEEQAWACLSIERCLPPFGRS